jgi:hypothetical protein
MIAIPAALPQAKLRRTVGAQIDMNVLPAELPQAILLRIVGACPIPAGVIYIASWEHRDTGGTMKGASTN